MKEKNGFVSFVNVGGRSYPGLECGSLTEYVTPKGVRRRRIIHGDSAEYLEDLQIADFPKSGHSISFAVDHNDYLFAAAPCEGDNAFLPLAFNTNLKPDIAMVVPRNNSSKSLMFSDVLSFYVYMTDSNDYLNALVIYNDKICSRLYSSFKDVVKFEDILDAKSNPIKFIAASVILRGDEFFLVGHDIEKIYYVKLTDGESVRIKFGYRPRYTSSIGDAYIDFMNALEICSVSNLESFFRKYTL